MNSENNFNGTSRILITLNLFAVLKKVQCKTETDVYFFAKIPHQMCEIIIHVINKIVAFYSVDNYWFARVHAIFQ